MTCWKGILGYRGNCFWGVCELSAFYGKNESHINKTKAENAYRFADNLADNTIIWCTDDTHDMEELVLIVPSTKERNARNHLCKDATTGPDVDRGTVSTRTQEDIGCAIPESNDLGAQVSTAYDQSASLDPPRSRKC